MQIISYMDSSFAGNETFNFERLFRARKPQRNHAISVKPQPTFKWEAMSKTVALVSGNLKTACFVLIALYSLILFLPFAVVSIMSSARPLKITVLNKNEKFFLDSAMKKYAVSDPLISVNDSGFLQGTVLPKYSFETVSYQKYVVQPGDNITKITKKFGLSNISTIISVNKITSDRGLMSGETLLIPSMDGIFHVVSKNESLSGIAKSYGIQPETLLDTNDLSTSILKVGQNLFIPGKSLDPDVLKQTLGILFSYPIKARYRLTSGYGYRADPFTGVRKFHSGIDMACPQGTAVYCSHEGKVIETSYNLIFGNYVIVSHSNGYQTLYAHLNTIICKIGDRVDSGTKLGLVGSTGYSTGPHLHFTVYKNGRLVNPNTLLR